MFYSILRSVWVYVVEDSALLESEEDPRLREKASSIPSYLPPSSAVVSKVLVTIFADLAFWRCDDFARPPRYFPLVEGARVAEEDVFSYLARVGLVAKRAVDDVVILVSNNHFSTSYFYYTMFWAF